MFHVSRAAYCLWAGPSEEVHAIPFVRCSKAWLGTREARHKVDGMVAKLPRTPTSKLKQWGGPLNWSTHTAGLLPPAENNVTPSDNAPQESIDPSAKQRKAHSLRVYRIIQLEWERHWLEWRR